MRVREILTGYIFWYLPKDPRGMEKAGGLTQCLPQRYWKSAPHGGMLSAGISLSQARILKPTRF